MLGITVKGDLHKTKNFLNKVKNDDYMIRILEYYGQVGVSALEQATPKDTGNTAGSWSYTIERNGGSTLIVWSNSNLANGYFPVALELQYGHGTGTGGYVRGIDYINPALRPIFNDIAETVWKVVQAS